MEYMMKARFVFINKLRLNREKLILNRLQTPWNNKISDFDSLGYKYFENLYRIKESYLIMFKLKKK